MRDDIFKVQVKYHCNIDKIMFGYLTHPVIDFAKQKNLTPNHITTLSFVSQLFAISFLSFDYKKMYTCLYLLGYYFDCIDGPMARKYNMITKFGDWYDHVTDILCCCLANLVYVYKYNFFEHYIIVALYVIFFSGLMVYIGCQETIFNKGLKNEKQKSGSLILTTKLIKNEEENYKKFVYFSVTNCAVLYSITPHFL